MKTGLIDIPGLFVGEDALWKVKAMVIDGEKCLAIDALEKWSKDRQLRRDYELIIEAIQVAANVERVMEDGKSVKRNHNPAYGDVYEFRAYDYDTASVGKARLMFFYDDEDDALIICTNSFEKGAGKYADQDLMFGLCARFRDEYERNKQNEK
jgi:hypothetical protein